MNRANQKGRGMLRVFSTLFTIACMLSLTACKSRDPITADAFKEKVEGLEYTTVDITDQYESYPHMQKVLLCADERLHVEFCEIDSNDNAAAMFSGNKAQVEAYKGNTSSESSVNTGNYQKYTLKTAEKYYLVERVGSTLIYAYCEKSESENLDRIIEELGY